MVERSLIRREASTPGRLSPGIRLKFAGFLLPLVFLLILTVAWTTTQITDRAVLKDLLGRGMAISRMVALSAGYSMLSGDRLALDTLAAETKKSTPDIEFVAIRDANEVILAHNRLEERGQVGEPPARLAPLDTFHETRADDVLRGGRAMFEFTSPILFAGKRIGTVSLGLSKESVLSAQRNVRRSITFVAMAVMGTALLAIPLIATFVTKPVKNLSSGVSELTSGAPFHQIPVRSGDELGELTRNFNRMAEEILSQKESISRYAKELEAAYISTVEIIAASIDARDPYTLGHSQRVVELSCNLGESLGYAPEEIDHLKKACLFHDVGKLGIPDDILLKENALSPLEAEVMRRHPMEGAEILRKAPSLQRYIPVVQSHHEWYDGTGYPHGKQASEIPIHAQIIAIVDAYDAMVSDRPYRKGLSMDEALAEIRKYRGTQFAPDLTDAFVRMMMEKSPPLAEDLKGMVI